MKIGVVDAEIIKRKGNHRFPNLASMKISSYHKAKGDYVELLLNLDYIDDYDVVYISKVFTDTPFDERILTKENVKYGGTGFFFDKAEPLPYEIEHSKPDYNLYNDWLKIQYKKGEELLEKKIEKAIKKAKDEGEPLTLKEIEKKRKEGVKGYRREDFKHYLDYSIGYITRGCFRQCSFCVNKNHTKVSKHSPLEEFYEPSRGKIALLDDNFLGYPKWKEELTNLQRITYKGSGRSFKFIQGLDERLLTEEKAKMLCESNYDGEFTFAFDNISDMRLIESKISLVQEMQKEIGKKDIRFYILTGYDFAHKYDEIFWVKDIEDTFKRIEFLIKYGCRPYIMKHKDHNASPFRGTYVNLGRWCNTVSVFKKMSYEEFVQANAEINPKAKKCATLDYYNEFKKAYPKIAEKYYSLKYQEVTQEEKKKYWEQLSLLDIGLAL